MTSKSIQSFRDLEVWQLEVACRLKLIARQQLDAVASELKRCRQLLHGLQRSLVLRTMGLATATAVVLAAAWLIRSAIA